MNVSSLKAVGTRIYGNVAGLPLGTEILQKEFGILGSLPSPGSHLIQRYFAWRLLFKTRRHFKKSEFQSTGLLWRQNVLGWRLIPEQNRGPDCIRLQVTSSRLSINE